MGGEVTKLHRSNVQKRQLTSMLTENINIFNLSQSFLVEERNKRQRKDKTKLQKLTQVHPLAE